MIFSRLLDLFKDKQITEQPKMVVPSISTSNPDQMDASPLKSNGRSVHIGYNYLKGMDGNYEDSNKPIRRFLSLHKLLRGDYKNNINSRYDDPSDQSSSEEDEE